MHRDVKEIVGATMRALGGGEISRDEVMDLSFEADGELLAALNEAYIKLLEFAHDVELFKRDKDAFHAARIGLDDCLHKILDACDREPSRAALARDLWTIKASYEMEIYLAASGVEMTLLWPSQEGYRLGREFMSKMGAGPISRSPDRVGDPEYYYLENDQQSEALSAFRKALKKRKS